MLRGEIRLVDLEPIRGSEAGRRRPAVVVSNDRANATAARVGRGVVTVVDVPDARHQIQLHAIRRQFYAYFEAAPGVIIGVLSRAAQGISASTTSEI